VRTPASVRIARPEDLDDLRACYLAWGYGGGLQAADVVFVAEREGVPVGIVRRTVEHGDTLLRGMWVDPGHHREGVGSQLLAAFVADMPAVDCWCLPFAHLVGFYGQGGFEVVPDTSAQPFLRERLAGYRATGHDMLVMRRRLL
jgi:GNAT superfamily N-acetyltransferase